MMDDLKTLTGKVCDIARAAGHFLKGRTEKFPQGSGRGKACP